MIDPTVSTASVRSILPTTDPGMPRACLKMGRGPLAALLVGHRPLRVCFLLAPCQSNPSLPNRTPPHFQTGSKESVL